MSKEEESVFYVGMRDPIEIRRSLLESSKEMLQYLQRFEKFKSVRKEKEKETAKLKETIKEIQTLVRKLKAELPKTGLRAKERPKPKKVKKAPAKEESLPVVVEKPKEMSELEKLESELGEIEGRLTDLS